MKNLKSLQLVALAGVAAALTGCSSTDSAMNESSDANGAYRWVSSGGWVPITDAQKMVAFPPGWVPGDFGPVSYETYRLAPPAVDDIDVDLASGDVDVKADADASVNVGASASADTGVSASADLDADRDHTIVATSNGFDESLQPGDTFVEAAGADGKAETRRVILYTPFNSTGVGR